MYRSSKYEPIRCQTDLLKTTDTDTDPIYRYSKMVTLYCYSATYSLNIAHMQHIMLYLVIVSHFQPCLTNKLIPQVQILSLE